MEIKRLLLATDFSALAASAAVFARSLANRYGAELYVLHVREPVITAAPIPGLDSGVMTAAVDEDQLRDELQDFISIHCAGVNTPVRGEVITGTAVTAIAEYAQAMTIDLLVIGTHARGIMQRLVHGSTSKGVLENAGCAVLMVPLAATAMPVQTPQPDEAGCA